MKFQFSLEAVLRYRKMIERRERLVLETIQQEISATVKSIEHSVNTELDQKHLFEQQLLSGTSAVYLHHATAETNRLKAERKVLGEALDTLQRKQLAQVKALQCAQQERELLSDMRQQQLKSAAAAQSRDEQKAIDDLFLSRRDIDINK